MIIFYSFKPTFYAEIRNLNSLDNDFNTELGIPLNFNIFRGRQTFSCRFV